MVGVKMETQRGNDGSTGTWASKESFMASALAETCRNLEAAGRLGQHGSGEWGQKL